MLRSLQLLSHHFLSALSPSSYPSLTAISSSSSCSFRVRGRTVSPVRAQLQTSPEPLEAQLSESTTATNTTPQEDGPIELPPSSSSSSIFATTNDPSFLQVSTSVLLTGAISVFLFRSVRRRAKRAKELRVRADGVRTLKDEALDSLKAMKPTSVEGSSPPSPAQALLGGLAAGVIALVLYKFTTTIEAALNRQAISDNLSVRQITITVRTIVNGICYLATFVFGINSIGLFLYSGQLAIDSFKESPSEATTGKNNWEQNKESLSTDLSVENDKSSSGDAEKASDES
ncbi:hypothetical protein NE237_032597 [Protea cynaroides]|uniref:Transmembrane protein n=1 Tax=Protea cynaroides TaxID=273540 RepID=A0A9Q0R391_9MAGN|nr:hypothetical protein NE237_032597 [Protea cynaroides]